MTRYRDAGVNIDEADRAVSAIKNLARQTFTGGVITDIGGFGACFALPNLSKPVLISSVDGVGTKLKVAFLTGRHDTVGEDLVNHCVNDIAVQGAQPLFFLDYFATGKLDAKVTESVISGMARGCRKNGCALIGGETAEMPGFYADGEYDLAGFIVGAAERSRLVNAGKIRPGDLLLGLPSSGLHTNGYSLARKLLFEVARYHPDDFVSDLGCTVGEELLKVHRSYLQPIRELLSVGVLRGAAHITGGGITENTPRILPDRAGVWIDTHSWPVPPIFELLRRIGDIPAADFRRTFNLGIGMIVIVSEKQVKRAERILEDLGERSYRIGGVTLLKSGKPRVEYR